MNDPGFREVEKVFEHMSDGFIEEEAPGPRLIKGKIAVNIQLNVRAS